MADVFTALDYCIIAGIVVSAIVGIIRGLIRELLALLSWIISAWFAILYAPELSVYLDDYLASPQLQYLVALAGVFIVSLLGLSLVALILTKLLDMVGIAGTDRSLGALFGIVRGGAIVLAVMFFLRLTPATQQSWYVDSMLMPYFEPVYEFLDSQDFTKPIESLPGVLESAPVKVPETS